MSRRFVALAGFAFAAACGPSSSLDAGVDARATPDAAESAVDRDTTDDTAPVEDVSRPDTVALDEAAPDERAPDVIEPDEAALDATPPPPDVTEQDATVEPDAFDAAPLDAGRLDAQLADVSRTDAPLVDAPVDSPTDAAPTGPRSRYFPEGWRPLHAGGTADAMGRALPDFSYAGYHLGAEPPPCGAGRVVATVPASNGDGRTNATRAIQSAIDAACTMGGGVVSIPAGTYRITFPEASPSTNPAITVGCRNLVLRGAGKSATRLWLDDPTNARDRAVIRFRGGGSLYDNASTRTYALAADTTGPSATLELASVAGLTVGTYIAVRQDNTDAFRTAHRMSSFWPASGFPGIAYGRRITAITGTRVTLDAPAHYPLQRANNARVYAAGALIDEVGIESLSLGMTANTTSAISEPASDGAYSGPAGTAAYQVHASRALEFDRTRDGWVCDVGSFAPTGNPATVHLLSLGISLSQHTFRITVRDTDLANPQYRGDGGNGYLYVFHGNDALVHDSSATRARHGCIVNNSSSGMVFLRDTVDSSRYSDDSHRFLAHANLYDNVTLRGGWLQAVNRGSTSGGAGVTATQHVFWNTRVAQNHASARGCAVESAQWGYGYLLGSTATSGSTARLCPMSYSNSEWAALDQGAPTDVTESEGTALFPASLYEAQLALRCAREGIPCR